MSDEYHKNLSKWWEKQWEIYHYFVYALILSVILVVLYYFIAESGTDVIADETTRKFLLGIIADAVPTLLIIIISFALFRKISDKKAERQRIDFLSDLEHIVNNSMSSESDLRQMIHESGLKGIYDRHHREKVIDEIGQSNKEVRVLHTYLVEPNSFEDAFITASQNGAKIKILLLNPDSPSARQRSIDMWPGDNPDGADEAYVPSQIRLTVDEFVKIKHDNRLDNLEIRLYDTLLSVQIFLCDDELYLGFYPHGRKSLEAAQLRIFGQTYLSEQFLSEFDLVWDNAKPVTIPGDANIQHP